MNTSQIKLQIIAIQSIDWLLLLGLIGYLVYGYVHNYSAGFILSVGVIGLVFVHQIGRWSISRVAYLKQTLKRLESVPHVV